MKLCFISHDWFSIINFRGQLLREFIARGFHVTIIGPKQGMGAVLEYFDHQVEFICTDFDGKYYSIKNIYALMRYIISIRHASFDIVFSQYLRSLVLALLVPSKRGSKVTKIALIAGLGEFLGRSSKKNVKSLIIRAIAALALRRFDGILVQKEDDAKLIKRIGDCSVFNVGPTGFTPKEKIELEGKKLSCGETVHVAFVGRLLRAKGISLYLEVAQRSKAMGINCVFHVAGSIEKNSRYIPINRIQKAVKKEEIIFHGFTDPEILLPKVNIVIIPTNYGEGLPRIAQEASSLGCAVLINDIPGASEVVVDGKSGYCFTMGDPQHIIDRIIHLIENPKKLNDMMSFAQELSLKKFNAIEQATIYVNQVEKIHAYRNIKSQ